MAAALPQWTRLATWCLRICWCGPTILYFTQITSFTPGHHVWPKLDFVPVSCMSWRACTLEVHQQIVYACYNTAFCVHLNGKHVQTIAFTSGLVALRTICFTKLTTAAKDSGPSCLTLCSATGWKPQLLKHAMPHFIVNKLHCVLRLYGRQHQKFRYGTIGLQWLQTAPWPRILVAVLNTSFRRAQRTVSLSA